MSIPILVQVFDETRRLAIAGSAVAPGDFRLKKLIPPLEQAGQKAPVFARLAQAMQAVVDSNEKTAAGALLDLATLVNAVLYTQGETGRAGELVPLETRDLGSSSPQASARVLKPLLEALSSTGSGRLELIRDAVERGAFRDLRLIKPALGAIDDPYPEIATLIVEQVLPMYGKAILPELRARINIKERSNGHIHRLRLLHALDAEGSRDIVQQALAEGSKEMRVAAVECLGTSEDDVASLFEHAKAKARDVRAAALRALTAMRGGAAGVLGVVKQAIAGSDLELIVEKVRQSDDPEIHGHVLEQARQHFAALLAIRNPKEQGPAVERMRHLVACLRGRTDAAAEAFLLQLFDSAKTVAAIKSEPSGADLNELVAWVLSRGTPAMQQRLVGAHGELSGGMLAAALDAARRTLTPAQFYDTFSPMLHGLSGRRGRKGGNDRPTILADALVAGRRVGFGYYYGAYQDGDEAGRGMPELDGRWLDRAVELGDVDLVCALARPGHEKLNAFLSEQASAKRGGSDGEFILSTMVRVRHPGAADAIVDALQRHAKGTTPYFGGYWYTMMIADLPKSAAPKMEALLGSLPERLVDQLIDAVHTLKNKPD